MNLLEKIIIIFYSELDTIKVSSFFFYNIKVSLLKKKKIRLIKEIYKTNVLQSMC